MPTLVTRQTRRPAKKGRSTKIFLAIIGSLLLHALLLWLVAWVVPHWPRARPHIKSVPIELTVVSPAAATPAPASGPLEGKPTPSYITTKDDQLADHAPDDPAFTSDKDTLAASLLAANGNKPLPSTEGRNIPTFDFEPRPYRLATKAADSATSAPSAPASQPQAPAPDKSTPPPENKKPLLPSKNRPSRKPVSQPTPSEKGDLASIQAESSPSPEPPMPTPQETPTDEENSPPPPARPPSRQPQLATTNPSNVTSTGAPKPPGYQPQSIPSKMTGNINNRGKSAVAAIGTPLGRYQKAVNDAIGMLWYFHADERTADISSGTVKIHFYVTRDGHVKNVKFTSGNPNGALGLISEQAITEAQIDPMPPDVAETLDGGQLESEISFSFIPFDGFCE